MRRSLARSLSRVSTNGLSDPASRSAVCLICWSWPIARESDWICTPTTSKRANTMTNTSGAAAPQEPNRLSALSVPQIHRLMAVEADTIAKAKSRPDALQGEDSARFKAAVTAAGDEKRGEGKEGGSQNRT